MASSYAALVSLMNVLDIIIHPKYPVSHLDKSQIKSLFGKVNSLVDLLETYSQRISQDLEKRITDAAFAAEDTIESYLVDLKNTTSVAGETYCPLLSQVLEKAIQEMDLIIQEAMQVKENNGEHDQLLTRMLVPVVGSPVPRGDTVKMVGLEEETNHLIAQLTSHQSNRQIISIVGMGGLGKTTLAANVYNHPRLRDHFDVKAWVTISQVYTPRRIYASLLREIDVSYSDQENNKELGKNLHKGLWGRSYLIIIDDIWDIKVWDELIKFCPDNNNGSRILLTTRILKVANQVSSYSAFELQLLDADKSWDLLSKTVFEQEACPFELEHCGKEIAKNCKGLPLAIVVIGGLLKVSNRTLENWEYVERNIRSILGIEENEHCMKILSLSYHQLPIYLKPCFLYMATFPEDKEILVSDITKLWAADGFLKPSVDGKTLDEVALECLSDLISRNIVIVNKRNNQGEMTSLITHDLVRDLCIKESQKEKFMYIDHGVVDLPNTIESHRRLVVPENDSISYPAMQQREFSRSFILFRNQHFQAETPWPSLLRIFSLSMVQECLVEDIMQLVNLRFLKCVIKQHQLSLLASISWPLNLETLILRFDGPPYGYCLPVEIWKLWRLKHLIVRISTKVNMPDPPVETDFVLENLQTLEGVRVLSDLLLDRIPNIKILNIEYDHRKYEPPPRFVNFVRCHKLESLWFMAILNGGGLQTNKFPSYLRELTLWNARIPWENMTIVGSLPNLEFLSLAGDAFVGEEWKSVEGEFVKLTHLEISGCHLVTWTVEEYSHFHCLEYLELGSMRSLEEIPEVFGELMTLKTIKVVSCSESVLRSASQILEDQQDIGNTDMIVEGYHTVRTEEQKEELEGLLNDHFRIQISQGF